MADESNPLDVIRRKGGTMACPVCDERRWVSSGVNEIIKEPKTEVFFLSCGNCGFVRMHDMDMLGDD